jgi:Tfp pilus assembly protein PilO
MKLFASIASRTVLGLLMLTAILLCMMRVQEIRQGIAERHRVLEDAPAEGQRVTFLKRKLTEAESVFARVAALVPSRDGLVDVVTAISNAAKDSGVSVQIPQVELAAGDAPLVEDVHLQIRGAGSPAALVAFLHRVEHLPYILRITSWTIDSTQQVTVNSFTGVAPPDARVTKESRGSSLMVNVMISTKKQ